jgi:hypothetical protein
VIEGRVEDPLKPRSSRGCLCENAEWRVGAIRERSSAGVRDERKARGVVTVVMRPVAASLEANVAGDQMNDARGGFCTVAKGMGASCCAFL